MHAPVHRRPPVTLVIPANAIRVLPAHRQVNEASVDSLARSIAALGLLHSIGVRESDADDGGFTLIYGRHRLEAHKRLGRATIEAMVFDVTAEDAEAIMHAESVFCTKLGVTPRKGKNCTLRVGLGRTHR